MDAQARAWKLHQRNRSLVQARAQFNSDVAGALRDMPAATLSQRRGASQLRLFPTGSISSRCMTAQKANVSPASTHSEAQPSPPADSRRLIRLAVQLREHPVDVRQGSDAPATSLASAAEQPSIVRFSDLFTYPVDRKNGVGPQGIVVRNRCQGGRMDSMHEFEQPGWGESRVKRSSISGPPFAGMPISGA
jgi:hypothetical protein